MCRRLFIQGSLLAMLIVFHVQERVTIKVNPCRDNCTEAKCPAYFNCIERRISCHDRNVTYIPWIPCGIQNLNLYNCSISRLSVHEISNLTCAFETLKIMNLSDSKIRQMEGDVFTNLTQLEVLDLSSNKIIEPLLSIQRALGSLNGAPLHTLKLDRLWTENGMVREIFKYFSGSHLTYLSMRENQIIEFEDKVLENFTKLVHLDLHSNWINKINLSSGIETLEIFNLSHNQINIFPPVFCDTQTGRTRYNNLTNLDLSWNQIIVPSSPSWSCLKTLKAFNLSRNDMEDITNNDSFANLTALKTLILSEMRTTLRRIQREAIKSDSLQHLDLSGNGLNFEVDKEVASDKFNYLPNLMSLAVSDNDFGSVGTRKLTNLSHLETLIMRHVGIKFLLHKIRQKSRNGYQPLLSTFVYNTYVAYAEKDSAWVIHDLLKELEEARYNVYIRDRYSVPGVARCDEIVDNIYKSKTVILVLFENFMACQWYNYQLNVAQVRAVELGQHFMIPVLLEGISNKRMKISVQHLFRTLKPIEWARQSTKNRLF
ncbi:hypothetical protein CHS0354_009774 [Potamilus streckersoni]|uniref:TIR domain-containing protein n=1 Tax=Potamilus streckersoni TaxID=2493646 RepID=A0AAE0SUU3_9BIVA|nr:hypothetical protein CHS0354_009774 [Potamilus streckersoni]